MKAETYKGDHYETRNSEPKAKTIPEHEFWNEKATMSSGKQECEV
jgi:hypothetical protein